MALSNIEFVKSSGALGRRQTSEDGISGLLFYDLKPDEFGDEDVKQVFSLSEAEALGITADDFPVMHYHVSEFYRVHPGGSLYLGVYDEPEDAHDFKEIESMVNASDGRIRQLGIYTQDAFASSMVATIQGVVAQMEAEHKPLSVLLCADISSQTLTGLPDLSTAQAPKVSVLIGQDAGARGSELFTSEGKTIGIVGAALGCVARAIVHESIAWVGKFNVASAELDVIGFGEGTAYRGVTKTQLDEIDNKGYIFLQKHMGVAGTYFSGSWTCDDGDFGTIERNRAIDKAIRLIHAAYTPFLSSPVYVDPSSGKLAEDTVQALQAEGNRPVENMVIGGELSGARVFIDPDQNVLSTNRIDVTAELVPVGVARAIRVRIGFTPQLSN